MGLGGVMVGGFLSLSGYNHLLFLLIKFNEEGAVSPYSCHVAMRLFHLNSMYYKTRTHRNKHDVTFTWKKF